MQQPTVEPEAPPPAAVPTPVTEVDIEIDFGDMSLNGDAETRVVAGAAQEDDEIGLDGFDMDASLDGDFSDIEVSGPAP